MNSPFVHRYCLLLSLVVLFGNVLFSQTSPSCEKAGIVLAKPAGCGVQILDQETAQVYLAIEGAESLNVGQVIGFSVETASVSPAHCAASLGEAVKATCISSNLPCKAEFAHVREANQPLKVNFQANLFDDQNQICTWDFGFGHVITHGKEVAVVFPKGGVYKVCLTVTGAGCSASSCQDVVVSDVNLQDCGFKMEATAVELALHGALTPIVAPGQSTLQSVRWYNGKSNQGFSQEANLHFPLPDYGSYKVCADYSTLLLSGQVCQATDCEVLYVTPPSCYNEILQNDGTLCPTWAVPVCGCDGITYGNECEAMAAGLTSWWLGSCSNQLPNCTADFDFQITDGSLQGAFTVLFHNKSEGIYYQSALDFGDGSPLYQESQWDTVSHRYANAGIFLAHLSVWRDQGAVSTYSNVLVTDAASAHHSMPPGTGYVLPGDTNGDGRADVQDILNLGVAYHKTGPPRQNPSINWTPQLAANWVGHTAGGVNFKHPDCDGNGAVNEFDHVAIVQNFKPLDATFTPPPSAAHAQVAIRFQQDTLYLDPDGPSTFNISADVVVGRASAPVQNLYGLSYAVRYPNAVASNSIGYYTGEPFFGASNLVLWLQRNSPQRNQLDMGFVRKTGSPVSGVGRVAKIDFQADFIIIVDVILRQNTEAFPFVVTLDNLVGIDPNGNTIPGGLQAVSDTLWIKLNPTSSDKAPTLDSKTLEIMPNPAVDNISLSGISFAEIQEASVEIFDVQGQRVQNQRLLASENPQINIQSLPSGLYQVKIKTEKTVYSGRFVK